MSEHRLVKPVDLSAFKYAPGIRTAVDKGTGELEIHLVDPDGACIHVSGSLGYQRPSGPHGKTTLEPDVVHVELINVTLGRHLGTAALDLVIRETQRLGYHFARMQFANSSMVGAVERLRALDVIYAAYHDLPAEAAPSATPTEAIIASGGSLDAVQARQHTRIVEAVTNSVPFRIPEGVNMTPVDCVIGF